MAYSTQRAVSDGTLVLLNLSLDYFDRSEISVLIGGIVSPIGSGKWAWVGTTNKQISFSPAIANGVEVTIKRSTQLAAPMNQYTKGAQFIAETLDDNFNQVLRIAQEAAEGSGASDVYNNVDYHGFKIRNVGAAVDPSDVITLAQYQADANGAAASKAAAAASAANALQSQYDAGTSKDTAIAKAGAAATSATNAATSATNAATSASNAATSEGNALSYKTAAAASLTSFKNLYYGALASVPATRPDGSAVVLGDLYFDTGLSLMRVYQSSGWVSVASAVAGNSGQDFAARTLTASANMVTPAINGGPLAGLRNVLINGCMRVFQRGPAAVVIPPGSDYYTIDRWHIYNGLNVAISVNQAAQPAYSGSDKVARMRIVPQGTPTSGGIYINQRIEDSGTFAGQVATASAIVMTPEANVQCRFTPTQNFGVSGSASMTLYGPYQTAPAPAVNGAMVAPLSATFSMGSTVGKTLGSTPDFVEFTLELNPRTTSVISVTQIQFERGPVATPFEVRPIGMELALCQRYYQTGNYIWRGYAVSGVNHGGSFQFAVQMRAAPTVTLVTNAASNFPATNSTLPGVTAFQFDIARTANGTGGGVFADTWSANAEL